MNWAQYSKYVGDIFGAPLAIEASVAFFLESVFIGLWIFGWDKVSKRMHAAAIWIVALATNLSAFWILVANGWMQHPVGYVLRHGRAEMVNFWAVVTNLYALQKFGHQLVSAYTVGAFFVMGIAAWHLLRGNHPDFFKRSFRMAATFGLVAIVLVLVSGDFSAAEVARTQPTKFAAMESVWETQVGAGFNVFVIPNPAKECNLVQGPCIPHMLSYLAFHTPDGTIKGLKDFPANERPPVLPVFWSFRLMVGLGFLFTLLTIVAFVQDRRGRLETSRWLLRILVWAIPLPYIANLLGWTVAEVGRQPWIVYGVLKTADAVSRSISTGQVVASLIGFVLLYGLLGALDIYLLAKFARQGVTEKSTPLPDPIAQEA
jgi:cytochrome d ubiquinol oxidase subunit I